MKALANAIIHLASFIELSDDETIDPDAAVSALEQLAVDLRSASDGEKTYLKAVIREHILGLGDRAISENQRKAEFLVNFIEDLGI